MTISSKNDKKPVSTPCEQNAELLDALLAEMVSCPWTICLWRQSI